MVLRTLPDIVIDNMVTALSVFAAAQVAEATTKEQKQLVSFSVGRDKIRPVDFETLPFVNIWMSGLEPSQSGGNSRLYYQDIATISIDLFTKSLDQDCDGLEEIAAMSRLYYLAEQVRSGLFRLVNADYGLASGMIARKKWPSFSLFQNELKLPESEIVGGRWTSEIEYSWNPEDVTGDALTLMTIDAGKWAANYDY